MFRIGVDKVRDKVAEAGGTSIVDLDRISIICDLLELDMPIFRECGSDYMYVPDNFPFK